MAARSLEVHGHEAVAESASASAVRKVHAGDERVHRNGDVAVDGEHGRSSPTPSTTSASGVSRVK